MRIVNRYKIEKKDKQQKKKETEKEMSQNSKQIQRIKSRIGRKKATEKES